ncbi:hypothetical protein LEMA_P017820.1 [Plenodomus lingam JN3]|uniref:Uncharacterized protein n=1 Tax=Leptosphaeria maculans (strain JN3 / isolate v23.1.3 / race Av1-4-5-6-7-8) TaxID=985895 RepID=E5AAG1_LEPMJ|nr:hypothetical protein LEMA_P017820.1 [Plenodomus lingam JN3]CBY00652.1 hypothetical protein LEMA_P017820.1 [Plenodomus lingam JN3]
MCESNNEGQDFQSRDLIAAAPPPFIGQSSFPNPVSLSYTLPPEYLPHFQFRDADEIDSLPSSATSSTVDDEEYISDAEREWRESLQQLELLLTMVVVPYLGKYFGRKCAYWGWAKYMTWKYPVEVVISSPKTFKLAGAIEAAATI